MAINILTYHFVHLLAHVLNPLLVSSDFVLQTGFLSIRLSQLRPCLIRRTMYAGRVFRTLVQLIRQLLNSTLESPRRSGRSRGIQRLGLEIDDLDVELFYLLLEVRLQKFNEHWRVWGMCVHLH